MLRLQRQQLVQAVAIQFIIAQDVEIVIQIIILIRLVIIMNRFKDLRLVRIMEKPYLLVRYAEMVIMKQMELCQRGIII